MDRFTRLVTTASGVVKAISAQYSTDFASAVSTAQSEVKPKILDINNTAHANKRYSELT